MKKLILLLLATTLFISCDDSQVEGDLLGKWYHHKAYLNGEEQPLEYCNRLSSLNIFRDSIEIQNVFKDQRENKCVEGLKIVYELTDLGNGSYKFDDVLGEMIIMDGGSLQLRFEQVHISPYEEVLGVDEFVDIYVRDK